MLNIERQRKKSSRKHVLVVGLSPILAQKSASRRSTGGQGARWIVKGIVWSDSYPTFDHLMGDLFEDIMTASCNTVVSIQ